jgi:hypothetical protein
MRLLDVEGEHLVGFARLAIDLLDDYARASDRQFIPFAAHRFEQDRQVQFAASGNQEAVGVRSLLDAQRHVGQQLLAQALADLAAGDELAFGAGVRRVVDHEGHVQRRLVDAQHRQRFGFLGVGDRAADREIFDAGHENDIAGDRFVEGNSFEAAKTEHLADLGGLRRAMFVLALGIGLAVHHDHLLCRFQAAALQAADPDAPDITRVVEG